MQKAEALFEFHTGDAINDTDHQHFETTQMQWIRQAQLNDNNLSLVIQLQFGIRKENVANSKHINLGKTYLLFYFPLPFFQLRRTKY